MKVIKIENIELTTESLLTSNEVAIIYGVTIQTIRDHKRLHQDEIIEDRHFKKIKVDTKGGKQTKIFWTLEGIYMLGFFIKSEKAKKYRKAIAQLLKEIKSGNVEIKPTQKNLLGDMDNDFINELVKRTDIVRGYQGTIKRLENELAEKQSKLKEYERLLNGDADLYFRALESFLDRMDKIKEEMDIMKSILTSEPNKHQSLTYWGKSCFPTTKYPKDRLKRLI